MSHGTVVVVHGWLGSAADWEFLVQALPGWQVVPWELPGHGARAAEPVSDFAATAAELADFVASQPAPRVLLGYSMGARMALAVAVKHPTLCAGWVFESVRVGIGGEAERAARRRVDAERAARLREQGTEAFLREWYAMPLFASLAKQPALLEARIAARCEVPPEGWAQAVEQWSPAEQPDFTTELEGFVRPSLWVAGEHDIAFSTATQTAAAACAQARCAVVANAGHDVHAEVPESFIGVLREFLHELRD